MFFIVFFVILLLATIVGAVIAPTKNYRVLTASGGAFLLLALIVFSSVNSVGNGQVGLIYGLGGQITGKTGVNAGVVFVLPWESVTTANVKTRATQFKLDSFSSETQNVYILATLNYSIAPKDVENLYKSVGPGWFDVLVPTRINQAFKDETVKFRAVEIAPNRDQIRTDVLARLKRELAAFSIQVDDLNIDNISFSPAFTNAIEDKQIATQEAAAAKNRVATATAQANATIATAKGQAEANRLKERTLTPLLVQQNAIDKLNPNVKVVVVDGKSILNLGDLFGSTSTATK